ncbi:hypothetical protein JGU71_28325 [Antrihabitans sp. YC3-6]|uniref:Uncharacterized protein n=1 Tax=Antrihabitans stalagmiti TaxID=2799499 RepID=A0A934NWZ8_9NOCA|nr:hypothetical protein [Antrihabitans stalagmiti]MBJ8342803.1 hypothetical protein [Antrihabitans stalagmiti]
MLFHALDVQERATVRGVGDPLDEAGRDQLGYQFVDIDVIDRQDLQLQFQCIVGNMTLIADSEVPHTDKQQTGVCAYRYDLPVGPEVRFDRAYARHHSTN